MDIRNLINKFIYFLTPIVILSSVVSFYAYAIYLMPLFLMVLFVNNYNEKYKFFSFYKQNKILFYYFAYILISFLFSYDPLKTSVNSFKYVFISFGCIFYGIIFYRNKNMLEFLIIPNLILLLLVTVSLIFSIPNDNFSGGCGIGMKSFSIHQNTLASGLFFTSFGFFEKIFTLNKVTFRRICIIFYCFNIYIITLTQSRGTIISLLIFFLFFIYLTKHYQYLFIFAFLLVLGFLFNTQNSLEKLFLKGNEKYFGERRETVVLNSLSSSMKEPIFGIGYGLSYYPETKEIKNNFRQLREKSISILALLEEVGIIGLFLFLSYYLSILINIYRQMQQKLLSRDCLFYENLFFSMLVAFFIHAQIEGWWLLPGSHRYLFFALIFSHVILFLRSRKFIPKSQ